MSELSFFSTLQDIITLSDTELRNGIGSLSPNVVTDYVFYLRGELVKASLENERLQRIVENQQQSLNGRMANMQIEDIPASAPPEYDVASNFPHSDTVLPSSSTRQFNSAPSTSQQSAPLDAPPVSSTTPGAPSIVPLIAPSTSPTSPPSPAPFPHIPGSVWTLDQDGSKPNGIVEFLSNGSVRWSNGETHGHWELKNEGRLLEANFIDIFHEFEYFDESKEAVLKAPSGAPLCRMWLHGSRSELLSNELGCSAEKVYLISCDGTYVKADSDGRITTCSELSANCVFDVVQVQSCSLAFRTNLGQYLLVRPDGTLALKEGGSPNIREFFFPKRVENTQNKTTFLSYFDKYLSIGSDGSVNARSEYLGSREIFEVKDVSGIEFPETVRGSASSAHVADHADAILGEVFLRGHNGFFVSANVTCQETDCGIFEKIVVRKIAPNLVAFQSCFGKYLSAQSNGILLWNKESVQLPEQFSVDRHGDKFVFRSYYRRYITASRSGGLHANAESLLDCQGLFTVIRAQDFVSGNPVSAVQRPPTDPFPVNMSGSTWTWSHDGETIDGTITFISDGGTKWNNGPRCGNWKLKEGITLMFQTEYHQDTQEMMYIASEKRAVLRVVSAAARSLSNALRTTMWMQGYTGEIPYRSFDTSSIALRGHKNSYITVHLDKNIDCSSEELTPSTVFHVVQIKPDTVALQSSIGGFLSVDLVGGTHPSLTIYMGDTPGLQQFFKVVRVSNDKVTLLSFYGYFISALNDGQVVTKKKKAKVCEIFKVEDGSNPVNLPEVRRVSNTDYAAMLAARVRVGLRGYHGCFISANASCRETVLGDMELFMMVRVDHNVVAIRNCFGKFLSALQNGVLTWNRDVIKTSEQFTLEKADDKFLFRSSHGKYISALSGGKLEASRAGSGNCELFQVVDAVWRRQM